MIDPDAHALTGGLIILIGLAAWGLIWAAVFDWNNWRKERNCRIRRDDVKETE